MTKLMNLAHLATARAVHFGVTLVGCIMIPLFPQALEAQSAADRVDHTRGVVSANEAAIVRAEIIHTIEKYYEYFSTGQMDRIPQETHHVPWVFLGTGVFTNTAEETATNYRARRQMVLDQFDPDYQTSTYVVTGLCVLSRTAGITSGVNTRTNSTGGIVSVEGVSYLAMKSPQGWRIVAFSEITPDKVISC
ncbi:MAG TPA: hypothetical protein VMM35_01415 [Longimicrobiales bacterium]|nr:hypothetical protein [Longimicrobiales bacterium]